MNIKNVLALITFVIMFVSSSIVAQTNYKELFEKAKYTMETKGNLKAAIKQFEKIVETFPHEREYAAKSTFYVGLCYEKLGKIEAQNAYQRIVDNYPDQQEVVTLAKEKLSILSRATDDKPDKSFRVRQIHDNNPQLGFYGTVSNNGRYLSDVNWGHGNLALFDFKTKKYRDLTNTATWGDPSYFCDWSVFSPDDKQIAYYWFEGEDQTLRIIDIDELKPQILCEGNKAYPPPWPLQWSADGKYILAAAQDSTESLKEHSEIEGQIVLVSVKDGSIKVIKKVGKHYCSREDNIVKIGADLSNDGLHLVYHKFTEKDSMQSDIYLMGVNGEYDVPIIQHPANDYNPFWMPDGKHILFMSDRLGDQSIWIQRIKERKPIGNPVLIHTLPKSFRLEGMSDDGSFYYGVDHEFFDLYSTEINLSTCKVEGTPKLIGNIYGGTNRSPAFSSDGKQIAYISDPLRISFVNFKEGTLNIQNIETGNEQKIKFKDKIDSYDFRSFRWNKAGNEIMFIGKVKDQGRIQIYNTDKKEFSTLLKSGNEEQMKGYLLSPDEKLLYILKWSEDKKYELVCRDVQTNQERVLFKPEPDKDILGPMALSTDGKQLVIRERRNGKDGTQIERMVLISTSSGKFETLMERVYGDSEGIHGLAGLTWTPDDKYLIFGRWYKYPDERIVMYRFSIDDKKVEEIGLTMKRIAKVSFHPDGDKIVFQASRDVEGFYKIENIMSKLK